MNWDRFDYVVIIILLLLALGTAGFIWRGDRVGVRVTALQPPDGARDVSSQTLIRITFSEPMEQAETERRFQTAPPLEGSMRWVGDTLLFQPAQSLAFERTYTVTLRAGAPGQQGRHVLEDVTWTFRTGFPHVLYMTRDEQGHWQLFATAPDGGLPTQLTRAPQGIWGYAVHPESTAIVYSAFGTGESADLWQVDPDGGNPRILLPCPEASCVAPAWSADGTRLAYERQELSTTIGARSGPLASRIWLLDPISGDTVPLFEDEQILGREPLWSPAGQRLAFYSPPETAVQIYDMLTGQLQSFETLFGIGSWSPQGDEMVIPDAALWSDRSTSYIARVDLVGGGTIDISAPTATAGDTSPAWSPTGEWIAFGRFSLADGSSTQGRQLWLMRPDGSKALPLVTDADAEFVAYSWRPDGGALAYVRLPVLDLADPHPEIWVVPLPSGQPYHLATDATMPGWLP